MKTYLKGLYAESLAGIILYIKGYRIIKRRYKTKVGEIDIIALKGKILVFIEVKLRSNIEDCFYSISPRQQKRMTKTAEYFLTSHPRFHNLDLRFDAIFINHKLSVKHIKAVIDYKDIANYISTK